MMIPPLILWPVAFFGLYKLLDYLIRIPRIGNYGSRYILVTGCDSGFGQLVSKQLDALGCHVFAGCLTEKGEDELRKQCSSRLKTFPMNVADCVSVRKSFKFVSDSLPREKGLWGVINNAGIIGIAAPVEWLTIKNYQEVLDVNYLGLVDVTVTFLPLVKKEKGRIVNTASMVGRISLPDMAPYNISKYGVETFSDALRRQLRPYNMSVHIIEPGFFKTNLTNTSLIADRFRQAWEQCTPEIQDEYGTEFLEKSIRAIKFGVDAAVNANTNLVASAYQHALLASFPRARYMVGNERWAVRVLEKVPEWMSDLSLGIWSRLLKQPVPKVLN